MIQKLIAQIRKKDAPVVVGLDPTMKFIPPHLLQEAARTYTPCGFGSEKLDMAAQAVWLFNRGIVDAVADIVPAVKPQVAMYEQFGIPGMIAYYKTVNYCREKGLIVIGDVKRGDIGLRRLCHCPSGKDHGGRGKAPCLRRGLRHRQSLSGHRRHKALRGRLQ